MDTFPEEAEEKLGFDRLRRRLGDLTQGPLGAERIREIGPLGSLEAMRRALACAGEYQDALRYDDPVPLRRVPDVRDVLRKIAPEDAFVAPDDLLDLRSVMVTARRVHRYFSRRERDYPHLREKADPITPLRDAEDKIEAVVEEGGSVRDDASPELQRLRRRIDETHADLRDTLRRELASARREGHATEDQPTLRSGRMVIPVRASAKRKVDGFVQDVSASGQTVYIEPTACLELNNALRDLEAEARREVERLLREVAAHLRQHLDALRANLDALARFDALQAKARLANDTGAHVPTLTDEAVIDVREGRNPLLLMHFREQAADDEDPREVVPLDLALGEDRRTLVITGPNAGGKTVAMKTVGLFALMLACGLPVPAAPDSRFGRFDKLLLDVGDEQSIEDDLSTFSSHVSNLRHMLREAGERSLVLIDEAGTGTDPDEGGALAQAILEQLTDAGTRTIATTHHGTLKAFAHTAEGVENGSMAFDQETLEPSYQFRAGTPGSSYAFEIARRIGLEGALLDRARDLVGEQKAALEELIGTFETRNQELKAELDEARTARRKADAERETLEGRLRKLNKERDRIREQALEQAEEIVGEANARIERTIREIKEAEAEREATQEARADLEEYKDDLEDETVNPQPGASPETEPPDHPAPIGGDIEEGDRVLVDGEREADVAEIDADEAVVMLGAMRMRIDRERLTRVGTAKREEQQVSVAASTSADEDDLPALSARPKADLRGMRVSEARSEVEELLDEAVSAGLGRVEILHGKGTGALREAVHELLSGEQAVTSFEEAPIEQGGAGVTHVRLQ